VSEVAFLLEELLSSGSLRVPGGLRYTIARALLNVEAPPFESLEQFSLDLSRHERGDRAEIVRRALARARDRRVMAATTFVERRRSRYSATALRRELREADLRLYQTRAGLSHEPTTTVIDLVASPGAPKRDRTSTAAAACLAAGLSLIAVGELMHSRSAPSDVAETDRPGLVVEARPVPLTTRTVLADTPRGVLELPVASPAPRIAVRDVSSARERTSSRVDARRVSVTRTARPPATTVRPPAAGRRAPRGVLDRLRLGWLRRAFTTHSDL
jgi:hypothetical protein